MLMPKRTKHRKVHRGRRSGVAKGGTHVVFGEYGLQALESGWITARQIESARVAITRAVKRGGKGGVTDFPHKPVTQKPDETRLGPGHGNEVHVQQRSRLRPNRSQDRQGSTQWSGSRRSWYRTHRLRT